MENILTLNTSTSPGPVRQFWRRTWMLFLHPKAFFREEFPSMGGAEAATFGLTNAWLAALVSFFVSTLSSLFLAVLFERWVQNLLASDEGFGILGTNPRAFVMTAGMLLLAPFIVLARVFFGGVVVYLFTRLLVEDDGAGEEPIRFSAILKLEAVCQSARWFSVVPVFGGVLAFIVNIILLVTGIRERFALSTRRSCAIVLAPYLLLFFFSLLLLGFFVFALAQMPLHELLAVDSQGFGF